MWVTGGVPVTHLRKIMLEELQRRNYAQHTTRSYIRTVEDFARHFNCSPDRLGPRHIREYQAELFEKRKLSAGSVAVRLAALRFFYCKTLKRTWSIADTPYPKGAHHLPTILSLTAAVIVIARSVRSLHGNAGSLRVDENCYIREKTEPSKASPPVCMRRTSQANSCSV